MSAAALIEALGPHLPRLLAERRAAGATPGSGEADLRAALGATAARPGPAAAAPRHGWAPLSDAQWQALAPLLGAAPGQPRRRGRPARNLRRTVDAIFWVAAGSDPWQALPPALGSPGTAHQTLRRWARAGVIHQLLVASRRRGAPRALRALGWLIARAFRRIGRLLPMRALADAARRNIRDALPAWPLILPAPNLSKSTSLLARSAVQLAGSEPEQARGLMAAALAAVRAAQKQLRAWRYR